jgi:hypothetical protein
MEPLVVIGLPHLKIFQQTFNELNCINKQKEITQLIFVTRPVNFLSVIKYL